MFEKLIHIDQEWLVAINGWHSEWADSLMWIISRPATWIPLYLAMVAMLVGRYGRKRWYMALLAVLAIAIAAGLADYISSGIIKPLVCRLRPTHEPAIENLLHIVRGYRGGMYGFVSSHAANTMAVATLFSLIWGELSKHQSNSRLRMIGVASCLGLWCVVNCYSRMYLGVHYPGDIIGGLLVGLLVGVGIYLIWRHFAAVAVAKVDGGAGVGRA